MSRRFAGRRARALSYAIDSLEPRRMLAGLLGPVTTFGNVGDLSRNLVTADFTQDGVLDLVAVNERGPSQLGGFPAGVTFFLGQSTGVNQGTGGFDPGQQIRMNRGAWDIVAADFNNDGRPDIATANFTNTGDSNTVSVVPNTGASTFASSLDIDVGPPAMGNSDPSAPMGIAAGDFNGDGKIDIAASRPFGNKISILLNITATNDFRIAFAPFIEFNAGGLPGQMRAADMNADGKLDLITANGSSSNVSVYAGNGLGGFSQVSAPATGAPGTDYVTVGDFNGDSRPDIAAYSKTIGSADPRISIFLNTTQTSAVTTFAPKIDYHTPIGAGLTSGDLNGDGRIDLALSQPNGNNKIRVLLGTGNGQFVLDGEYATNAEPGGMAIGDFNGDKKPDIANVTFDQGGTRTVGVLLGRGGFAPAVNYGAGDRLYSVATGDFNGDGKTDLATANAASDNVSILLGSGSGSGTFATAINYGAGDFPESVATGDFNSDGRTDLAVANYLSSNVSILLGSGSGTFAAAVNYPAGTSPSSVATADFNGDGRADLAVANAYSNNVSILLGSGSGTFATAVNYGAGTGPYSVATGDFNGDGRIDLAVANLYSSNVSVLLGSGSGTFATAVNYGVGIRPRSVIAGDFNSDGRIDLATANTLSNNVSVLLGSGSGTFATAVNYGAGTSPISVATSDFNGDGRTDLATANSLNNNVSILLGSGSGAFATAVNYGAGSAPFSVATGDFNGDGRIDLATANFNGDNVSVLLGNGFPAISGSSLLSSGGGSHDVAAADFNGDGFSDFVASNAGLGFYSILFGDATGTFPARTNYATSGLSVTAVAAADFNGDGKPDVATAAAYYETRQVSIRLNAGNGTLGSAANYNLPEDPTSITTGDFDGDGDVDIAAAGFPPNLQILLNNGLGVFTLTNAPVGEKIIELNAADLNGDGRADLVNLDEQLGRLNVRLNTGGANFAIPEYYGEGSVAGLAMGDLNSDGRPDLVLVYFDRRMEVLNGNPDGTFSSARTYTLGRAGQSAVIADINADGRPDVVVSFHPNGVQVFYGSDTGVLSPGPFTATGSRAEQLAVGDFNGDRKPDVVYGESNGNLGGALNQTPRALAGAAPSVTSSSFNVNTREVVFNFDLPIDAASLLPTDLTARNLSNGVNFINAVSVSQSVDRKTVRFVLPTNLPDGNYRFRLGTGAVRGENSVPTAATADLSGANVYILAGDANRDRAIDIDDFGTLAANFNRSPRLFQQGDFDYSGTVDIDDFGILASKFNQSLAPASVARVWAVQPIELPGDASTSVWDRLEQPG